MALENGHVRRREIKAPSTGGGRAEAKRPTLRRDWSWPGHQHPFTQATIARLAPPAATRAQAGRTRRAEGDPQVARWHFEKPSDSRRKTPPPWCRWQGAWAQGLRGLGRASSPRKAQAEAPGAALETKSAKPPSRSQRSSCGGQPAPRSAREGPVKVCFNP